MLYTKLSIITIFNYFKSLLIILNNEYIQYIKICFFFFLPARDTVAEASPARRGRRAAAPADPPARVPAAPPAADRVRRLYRDVTVHPASLTDGVSRGRCRERTHTCVCHVIALVHTTYYLSRTYTLKCRESTVIVDFNLRLLSVISLLCYVSVSFFFITTTLIERSYDLQSR